MMSFAIQVNGEFLDIDDQEFTYTISEIDVLSFDVASGNSSPEFTIPLTNTNSRLLGYVSSTNVDLSIVRNRINATLYLGTTVVDIGFLQVNEINPLRKTVRLQFYSGNSDWIDLLSSKKINEADLTTYSHLYTRANIAASRTATEGYIYPLLNIDNSLTSFGSTTLSIDKFYPCIYASSLIKALFNDIGYIVQGDLLDLPFYKRIILYSGSSLKLSKEYIEARFSRVAGVNTGNLSTGTGLQNVKVTFSLTGPSSIPSVAGLLWDEANSRWVADGVYRCQVFGNLYFQDQTFGRTVRFDIYKNGVLQTSGAAGNINGSEIYTSAQRFDVVAGDIIEAYVQIGASALGAPVVVTSGYLTFRIFENFVENSLVDFSAILPDITQSDFLKSILALCNGTVSVNTVSKVVTLSRFKQEFSGPDWSDKLDLNNPPVIKYNELIRDFSQKNHFVYQQTDNVELLQNGLVYGSGTISIDYDLLDLENKALELPYVSAVEDLTFTALSGSGASMPKLYEGDPVLLLCEPNVPVASIFANDSIASITVVSTVISTMPYAWFYKIAVADKIADIPDQLVFDHPSSIEAYGLSIFERFYPERVALLQSGIFVEVYMRLTQVDVLNINFNKLVFVDYLRSWVRINRIVEYNPKKGVILVEAIIVQ